MKKHYTLLVLLTAYCLNFSYAQCDTAVATVDDGFESYTTGGSLASANTCWTALDNNSLSDYIGIRNTGANTGSNCISGYTFFGNNTVIYFVSPKLNSIDGNHLAEFYLNSSTTATLEMGTMSAPDDSTTFTSISGVSTLQATFTKYSSGAVSSTSDEYFAIRISAPSQHTSIKFDDFKWQNVCDVENETIDENFESYPAGAGNPMPNCWSSIGAFAAGVRTDGVSNSNCIMSYNSSAGVMYLITPKLNTLNGNYQADFQIKANNNSATYQVGTMSDNSDIATFVAIGSDVAITDSFVNHNTGNIAATTNEYFAIKLTTTTPHTSIRLDSFKWDLSTVLATENFNLNELSFSIYPNPSITKQITIEIETREESTISIYDLSGRKVMAVNSNKNQVELDLRHLNSGMYVVDVVSARKSSTKKLIIK